MLGDLTAYSLVSLYGFSSHGLIGRVPLDRFLATFLPFTAAHLAIAFGLLAYLPDHAVRPGQLWRPALAALLAAPLGALGRGLWLETPPIPVFIGVMAAVSLVFVLAWRMAYLIVARRRSAGG